MTYAAFGRSTRRLLAKPKIVEAHKPVGTNQDDVWLQISAMSSVGPLADSAWSLAGRLVATDVLAFNCLLSYPTKLHDLDALSA